MPGRIVLFINKIRKNLFIRAFEKLLDDEGLEYAGYMAYLNIFSLFPIFITILALLTQLGETATGNKLVILIASLIPEYSFAAIQPQLIKLTTGPSVGVVSFAFIGALWTATSTFEGLRKIFNKMYNVQNPPFFVITRLMSIVQFLAAISILLLTLTSFVFLPKFIVYIERIINYQIPSIKDEYWNKLYTATILTIVICSIYYSLTNKKISFVSVLPGAIVTVILWFLSAMGMSYYMNNFQNFDFIYGGLAGVIIMLLFFYIINASLLYGMEINVILYRRRKLQSI